MSRDGSILVSAIGRRHKKGRRNLSAGLDEADFAMGLGLFDLVLHPIAFAFDADRLGVVQQTIEER